MSTQKQIDANRRNAQKSTGPKTPAGLAAIRYNAVKHGLTASQAVLDIEDKANFKHLLNTFRSEYNPVGTMENLLVEQMVFAAWRLRRHRILETAVFNKRMTDHKPSFRELTDIEQLAYAMQENFTGLNPFSNLARYESKLERSLYRALRHLQRLRLEKANFAKQSQVDDKKLTEVPSQESDSE